MFGIIPLVKISWILILQVVKYSWLNLQWILIAIEKKWLKSCLHVWGYVFIKFKVMFISLLYSCLQLCWKIWSHCFERNVYTIFKDIFIRHVYTMFEGMFTQCLDICLYKMVLNVSNESKRLIIELISANDSKWIKMVIMGKNGYYG